MNRLEKLAIAFGICAVCAPVIAVLYSVLRCYYLLWHMQHQLGIK